MKKKNSKTRMKLFLQQSFVGINKDRIALMVFGIAMFITSMHVVNPRWNMRSFSDSLIPDPTRAPRNTPTPKVLPTPPLQTIDEGKVSFNARNIYSDNGEYFIHTVGFEQKPGDRVGFLPDYKDREQFSVGITIQRNSSVVSVMDVPENSFHPLTFEEKASMTKLDAPGLQGGVIYRRILGQKVTGTYYYVSGYTEKCDLPSEETGACDSNMAISNTAGFAFVNCEVVGTNLKDCDDIVKSLTFSQTEVK